MQGHANSNEWGEKSSWDRIERKKTITMNESLGAGWFWLIDRTTRFDWGSKNAKENADRVFSSHSHVSTVNHSTSSLLYSSEIGEWVMEACEWMMMRIFLLTDRFSHKSTKKVKNIFFVSLIGFKENFSRNIQRPLVDNAISVDERTDHYHRQEEE